MAYGLAKLRRIAVTCITIIFLMFISSWIVRYDHENGSVKDTGTSVSLKQTGYLVILNIPEQFISALDDFVQLYMVNQMHWRLRMIEPYVLGSHIAFVPPVEEDVRSLPVLSTYFNRSHMLHNLKKCFHSDVDLDTFQDFLINAARAFIVLKFVIKGTFFLFDEDIYQCDFRMDKTEDLLNFHLEGVKEKAIAVHGPNYKFVGVYSLCIKSTPQKPFSMLQVVKYISQWMTKASSEPNTPKYTVVIPEWRSIRNQRGHYFYYDPSYTTLNSTQSCHLQTIPHSIYVTNAARAMLDALALPKPLIALHVRSERIARHETHNHVKGFIDDCVSKLLRVLEAVQKEYNVSRDNIIFTHDGSEYGSTSMGSKRRDHSGRIISKIQALGIRNVQYRPVNRTSVEFAAAQFIEKEVLASADILILAGSGNFQSSLIARFRSKAESGDKWYRVCQETPKYDHLPGLDL